MRGKGVESVDGEEGLAQRLRRYFAGIDAATDLAASRTALLHDIATPGRIATRPRRPLRWVVGGVALALVAAGVPVLAGTPLGQTIAELVRAGAIDPGMAAAKSGRDWHTLNLQVSNEGYALRCSGYYFDGYETVLLCRLALPASVQALADSSTFPILPTLTLTDAAGSSVMDGTTDGGAAGATTLYEFRGVLQPGPVRLTVGANLAIFPAAPQRAVVLHPHLPSAEFTLERTAPGRVVTVDHAGAVSVQGIRASVVDFVSAPDTTHVDITLQAEEPALRLVDAFNLADPGGPLHDVNPARGSIIVRPTGSVFSALFDLRGGLLADGGSGGGPVGGAYRFSGNFGAAPGVRSFQVEVPAMYVAREVVLPLAGAAASISAGGGPSGPGRITASPVSGSAGTALRVTAQGTRLVGPFALVGPKGTVYPCTLVTTDDNLEGLRGSHGRPFSTMSLAWGGTATLSFAGWPSERSLVGAKLQVWADALVTGPWVIPVRLPR